MTAGANLDTGVFLVTALLLSLVREKTVSWLMFLCWLIVFGGSSGSVFYFLFGFLLIAFIRLFRGEV